MATLLDAHLPSDDEEDDDFDPDKATAGGTGGGGKGGKGSKGAKRGFLEVSDGEDDDDDGGGGGGDGVAAGVCSKVADGLADALDDARYCAAAGPEDHDEAPAVRHNRNRARLTASSCPGNCVAAVCCLIARRQARPH